MKESIRFSLVAVWAAAAVGLLGGCGLEEFIDERVRFFEIEPRMYAIAPSDGAATSLPAYPTLRTVGHTAMVAGELVSLGGIDEKSKYNGDVQVFEPTTDRWRSGVAWPRPRSAEAAVVGDELCLSPGPAGIDRPDEFIAVVDCYRPQDDSWREQPSFAAGAYTKAGLLHNPSDGVLYVPVEQKNDVPLVFSLTPGAEEWQSAAGRACFSYEGVFINERAYFHSCEQGSEAKEAMIVEYDPATKAWTSIEPPSSITKRGRYQQSLGTIMVFLEPDDGGVVLYDVANNAWANFAAEPFAQANVHAQSSAFVNDAMYTIVASRGLEDEVGGEGVFEVWKFELNTMRFEKISDNAAAAWQLVNLHAHEGRLLAPASIVEPVLTIN